MSFALCALSLAAWPVQGGPPASEPPHALLYWQADHEVPPPVMAALKAEVAAIFEPSGMRFDWRPMESAENGEGAPEIAVVEFRGRCDTDGVRAGAPSQPGRLGWTHVSGETVLHFSGVDCGQVRNFVEAGLARFPAAQRDEVFGRALGRVVAHELIHVFAQTVQHHSGASKSAYTVDDLLFSRPKLAKRDSVALAAR